MKNKLTQYALKYGLTAGVLSSAFLIGFSFIDQNPIGMGRTLLQFIILPIFILFSILEFRSKLPHQLINYTKAILVASFTAIIVLSLYTISEYSLMRSSPEKFEVAKEQMIKEWEKQKGQIEKDQGIDFYKKQLEGRKEINLQEFALVSGPISSGVWVIIWTVTLSLCVSIWDQKKRKKITDQF